MHSDTEDRMVAFGLDSAASAASASLRCGGARSSATAPANDADFVSRARRGDEHDGTNNLF